MAALLAPIQAYHADAPPHGDTLQVVYFHPSDVESFKEYQDRIQRIMVDIQTFYRTEMQRLGLGDRVFALDIKDGRLNIHLVRGDAPSADYQYESSDNVRSAIERELAGRVDLRQSYVMVFCGLCDTSEDGIYFFHSPYYGDGGSNHRWGLCYAADCDLLDTRLFTETERNIRYEEHLGKRFKTLADFNCLYIGGVAHELGHALSLPHNRQTPAQSDRLGTALMGSGNATYRKELRGGKGSFLTLASGLRLSTHPLFTGSRRGVDLSEQCEITGLRFSATRGRLIVEGSLEATPPVAGVIAYCDPEGHDDYDALTWVTPVDDGHFRIEADEQRRGRYALRLAVCHVNGAVSTFRYDYRVNGRDRPEIDALNDDVLVRQAEKAFIEGRTDQAVALAEGSLPQVQGKDARAKLKHLISLRQAAPPRELADVSAREVALSDVEWQQADIGWGEPCRDHFFYAPHSRNGLFLQLGETFYPQGLYAHAPSRYAFSLGGRWKRFRAEGGLQQGTPQNGTAVFVIRGDGNELFRSEILKPGQTVSVDVALDGMQTLELLTETGKTGNACCWSIWAAPRLLK